MNPSVQSALIAAGVSLVSLAGTVVVAVSGFRNSRRVSIETSLTAADTAHRERLWEKQAATYEEALAALLYRHIKRNAQMRMFRNDEENERHLAESFADLEEGQWVRTRGRILAYASPDVIDGVQASGTADQEALVRYDRWKELAAYAAEEEELRQARENVQPAIERAAAAEQALIALIQADLHRKPSQALSPVSPSPEPWPGLMGPPDPA